MALSTFSQRAAWTLNEWTFFVRFTRRELVMLCLAILGNVNDALLG